MQKEDWLSAFGVPTKISVEDYGLLQSKRIFYADGLEVEFGITTRQWLATEPLDRGTREVLSDGYQILDDKAGLFSRFFEALESESKDT